MSMPEAMRYKIMNGVVSKSKAVKYLCEDYNILIKVIVSFGDNFNDVDMLLAGLMQLNFRKSFAIIACQNPSDKGC